ncbi:MAG: glycoside hydrolase family 2, partial [Clostridia bacterium]|nr:glycoside hydrolase family 2 [Clostridia bacterium]
MSEHFVDLYTAEGETLTGQPWNTYPRPQLRRDSFFCLNGEWEFSTAETEGETIRVPFPPESLLSGIHRRLGHRPLLTYKKTFTLPESFNRGRVLLHFGAVDQSANVQLNGVPVGSHRGGYEAFCFDITDYLQEENTLTVVAADALDSFVYPYGKQCEKRGGMWYTPVTGIWQTVWLESVPETYIRSIRIETGADWAEITTEGVADGEVTVTAPESTLTLDMENGKVRIELSKPRMWSPEDPYLYEFTVTAGEDTVQSYFALRTLTTEVVDGHPRLCLNGKPYFFHGLLDQGYWSDGLFLPATPEGYANDILQMKKLGFNTLRKHIKVEPEQFYYDCDRLGMIVFQDMVNNGDYNFVRDTALPTAGVRTLPDTLMHTDKKTRKVFEESMEATVKQLYNHPCICYWTIFNEGWGQFCSGKMYEKLKKLDSTRFIDSASGWFAGAPSDVVSPQIYFKPGKISPAKKPILLSEFGGYSLKVEDHVFN